VRLTLAASFGLAPTRLTEQRFPPTNSIENGCTLQPQTATDFVSLPRQYSRILARSEELGFTMNSDVPTGTLLRALAASKPAGSFLELGTGCGLGTCWILDGMSDDSRLLSIDTDSAFQAIARAELGHDDRVSFQLGDAGAFLESSEAKFDMIYADAWPGKYSHLDEALALLKPGGIYVVDDMLPQPNWPDDHAPKAKRLLADLQSLPGIPSTFFGWSTGIVMCVKQHSVAGRTMAAPKIE
jgi:predicted O-methyltransferase YrrM